MTTTRARTAQQARQRASDVRVATDQRARARGGKGRWMTGRRAGQQQAPELVSVATLLRRARQEPGVQDYSRGTNKELNGTI
jgi:hypothetical protein